MEPVSVAEGGRVLERGDSLGVPGHSSLGVWPIVGSGMPRARVDDLNVDGDAFYRGGDVGSGGGLSGEMDEHVRGAARLRKQRWVCQQPCAF